MSDELFDQALPVAVSPVVELLAMRIWWDYHQATARYLSMSWKDVNEETRGDFREYASKIIERQPL